MNGKVRALFVSDYRKLGEMTREIARQRGDIDVDVEYDVMENGVLNLERLANADFLYRYDVFIARGEVAHRLRRDYHLPVVDIPVSAYDVLKTLKLAQTYGGKAAIVNNSVVSADVSLACELMGYPIDSYTVATAADAVELLEHLQKENYTLIVGGHLIVSIARRFNMNGVVISSGEASINDALSRAISTSEQMERQRREHFVLKSMLDYAPQEMLAFDAGGRVLYASMPRTSSLYAELVGMTKPLVGEVLYGSTTEMTFHLTTDAGLWIIRARRMTDDGGSFVIFYLEMGEGRGRVPGAVLTVGGGSRKVEEADDFNPFNGISKSAQELQQTVELYAASDCSVLICGSEGSGKRELAEMLHNRSRYRNELVCTLHCDLLSEAELEAVFAGEQPPFSGIKKCTLILDHVDALSLPLQIRLYRLLGGTKFRRYRLLALSSRNLFEMVNAGTFHYKLYKKISELVLTVPSLESRREDFAGMCGILIGMFNEELGTGITGIERTGISLLQAFPWGDDVDHFKAVIRKLVLLSEQPVVTAGTVRGVLSEEKPFRSSDGDAGALSLDGSLDEIVVRVIRAVVAEEKSETRAAKRLGISRTTIWRKRS